MFLDGNVIIFKWSLKENRDLFILINMVVEEFIFLFCDGCMDFYCCVNVLRGFGVGRVYSLRRVDLVVWCFLVSY